MGKSPRRRTIPRPSRSLGADDPDLRRTAQRSGSADDVGDGQKLDRRGRAAFRADEEGVLEVDHRGVRLKLADAFRRGVNGELQLSPQGRWRPNRLTPLAGGYVAADYNDQINELQARIEALAKALIALGALEA